jgi:hypothetical protein
MPKKFQVVLPDWLEDYIQYLVERYDLNFSEILRMEICISILSQIQQLYPDFKPGVSVTDVAAFIKSYDPKKIDREQVLRFLSKIYFETRKGVEYRIERDLGKKKKAF